MDYSITLPSGQVLDDEGPIVIIGPNGSGKTRQTRNLTSSAPIEFVNALRNTRVAPELPAMGMDTARSNFQAQRNQSRNAHWELSSEFDSMLSQLLAQKSMAAIEFTRRYETNPTSPGQPEVTPLTQVERLWGQVFPERELHWQDWKPLVKNRTSGSEIEYTGNTMSDGEKAALYLAGRVFSSDPGVLVVDEPETHFHSLLSVRLWNALEDARPDIRFVYVTHDLTFALSRRNARFVLADPTAGLRAIDVDADLPDDVADALLGSASLSFYASRVVFCEGEASSLDTELYKAWFNGPDTVVRGVGSCQRVLRCVDALGASGIAHSLTAIGVVDSDFHPDAFKEAMPEGVFVLKVHEVESLLCLPGVVEAVCEHLTTSFDESAYRAALVGTVNDTQRHRLVVNRWKARIEPQLEGLVADVQKRKKPVEDLVTDLPDIFNYTKWAFSPADILAEEQQRVEGVIDHGSIADLVMIVPGKQLLPEAAKAAGLTVDAYKQLVVQTLGKRDAGSEQLAKKLETALQDQLPARYVAAAGTPGPAV
jgi:hypothetical protein